MGGGRGNYSIIPTLQYSNLFAARSTVFARLEIFIALR